jgi:CarD family transcriptional regulator
LLRVGDKVIYPQHGAAVVKGTEEKEVLGEKRKYYVLRLTYGDLTLKVPTDNTELVGIRDVIARDELDKVFKVLKVKECRMPSNWSRRFKTHLEKLRSGDIYQVAEVVRNLARREKEKGLSAGEKRMLSRAKQILLSEVVFAADVNEAEAENMLDKVLAL